MAVYEAEIGPDDRVIRVVVSPELGWAAATLGGDWIETSDPYGDADVVLYAGIGYGHDRAVPERFVGDEWSLAKATTPDPNDGSYRYVTQGELTWFNGRAWRNLLPDGSPNVWEPGVANWRDYPLGDEHPIWVQPSGAFDAYPVGFVVEHDGSVWESDTPANVWEPGVANWIDLNPMVTAEWVQPTGAHDAYPIGAEVSYGGSMWRNTFASNAYAPGVYGWEQI